MAMEGTVQSIEVSADAQTIYEVALDLDGYPEWATGVKEVEIHEEDEYGRPVRVSFVADAMIKEISYILLYRYELDNGFSWSAEPGVDIKAMEGSYRFNTMEEGGMPGRRGNPLDEFAKLFQASARSGSPDAA